MILQTHCSGIVMVISFVLAVQSAAQPVVNVDKKISADNLKADLDYLKNKLEASQPGLYLYNSKDSLDATFNSLRLTLTEPLTALEFFRKIAPLNGFLKNLHTRIWPSEVDLHAIENELPLFPLDVHWLNNKLYVLRNNSGDKQIQEGSEIRSINRENAEQLFTRLMQCTVRDGFNETYPVAFTSRNFGSRYAQIIGTPSLFSLELITPDGHAQRMELSGMKGDVIRTNRATKYKRKYSDFGEDWDAWITDKEPAFQFEVKGDVAVLTLRTFHIYTIEANGQQYGDFFNSVFAQLAVHNIGHLIIDMRNNHGGHDVVGMSLMSRVHDATFYYYRKRSAFIKPVGKFVKKGDVYEIIGRRAWTGLVTPAKPQYTGKIYVLMNGYSVSAAGEFIGHLKNINRAVFIGEEAGGNPVSFIGGQSSSLDLPHSHLTGIIPLNFVEMNVTMENTGHGILPDYQVVPAIKDILQGKDAAMEKVLELIQKN